MYHRIRRALLAAILLLAVTQVLSIPLGHASPLPQDMALAVNYLPVPPLPPGVAPLPGMCWVPAILPMGLAYVCNAGNMILAIPATLPPGVGPPGVVTSDPYDAGSNLQPMGAGQRFANRQ